MNATPEVPEPSDAPGMAEVAERAAAVVDEIERAVIGKREVVEQVLMAVLADGHVLVDDVPGVAKTLLARSLAQVLDLHFARIQMTPDVLPSDITGSQVLAADRTLVFRRARCSPTSSSPTR